MCDSEGTLSDGQSWLRVPESTVWVERSRCPTHLMVFPMPLVHLPAHGKRSVKHSWLSSWDLHPHSQPAGPVASSHLPLPSITGGLRISVQENGQIAFGSLSPFPCRHYANSENETNEQIQEIGCGFPVPLSVSFWKDKLTFAAASGGDQAHVGLLGSHNNVVKLMPILLAGNPSCLKRTRSACPRSASQSGMGVS